jgi:hypothetical protein
MASFTAGIFREFPARRNTLVVRIFEEILPDIRVAGLANLAADEGILRESRDGETQPQQRDESHSPHYKPRSL